MNSRRLFISLILFALAFTGSAFSADNPPESAPAPEAKPSFWKDKFRYSGELRQETAFRFVNDPNFSKIKQFAKIDFKFEFSDHYHLKIGGRAYYDAVYELTDQYPPNVQNNMRDEIALRDAYLDILYSKVNIRVGHQQIVWGEALGQFFADVVVPKDLREFLLPDFDYVRLPIWAIDLQYNFAPNATWEVVVSPDNSVDKLAPPGADFAFFIPPAPAGVDQFVLEDEGLGIDFKSWNFGTRISYLVKGWDLAWLFYTSPAHEPTLFKTLRLDPVTGATELFLDPQHHRVYHYGMTFSKGIKSQVLRGEFVYTVGRYFNSNNVAQNEGVVQKNNLRYVLGFDASLGGKVDMNAEFQQSVIFGSTTDLADPVLGTWVFLRFETGFFHEKLVPELIFIVGLIDGDMEISPKLHYRVTDSVELTWGADIFTGPIETLYGEFNHSDRVYMNTSWKF